MPTEKYVKRVNAAHRAAGKLAQQTWNIKIKKPVFRSTKTSDAATNKRNRIANVGDAALYVGKHVGRAGLAGGFRLSQFLLWLGKYVLVDNHAVRALEKNFGKLQLKNGHLQRKKNYPNWSAHLWYYTMLMVLIGGGLGYKQIKKEMAEQPLPTVKKNARPVSQAKVAVADFGAELIKMNEKRSKQISNAFGQTKEIAVADNFGANVIDKCWADLVTIICGFETWHDNSKLQSGEARHTYGPGLTWVYTVDKNGKIDQHECNGKFAAMASRFTNAQIWEQFKIHCMHETFPRIYRACVDNDITGLSRGELLGLFVTAWQRPGDVKRICKNIQASKNNLQHIIDSFVAGQEVRKKWRNGTNKRRWWSAMLYTGIVTLDDIVKMYPDAFTSVDINTLLHGGHFVMDQSTVDYLVQTAQSRNDKPKLALFVKDHYTGKLAQTSTSKHVKTNKTNPSMDSAIKGLVAYQKSDYVDAAKYYEQAITQDVDNMEAYSSLALVYKKLGDNEPDKDVALEHYERCADIVRRVNVRMNTNRDLLEDLTIKSASYFNAAIARESMAEIYRERGDRAGALKYYKLAFDNMNIALDNSPTNTVYKNALARLERQMLYFVEPKKITIEKNKKHAFEKGTKKLKQKNNYLNVADFLKTTKRA